MPAAAPTTWSDLPDAKSELAPVEIEKPSPVKPATPSPDAKIFLTVGNFKDASLAKNVAQGIETLGFHTVVIHRGKLWMSAYHVMVGPYLTAAEALAAKQSMTEHGFDAKMVSPAQ